MRRAVPMVALVLLLAGVAYFLLEGGTPPALDGLDDGGEDALSEDERERVLLEGDSQAAARLEAELRARERADAEAAARKRALDMAVPKVFLNGRVVDASNDKPIEGAYAWLEGAEQPCPRLPRQGALRRMGTGQHPTYEFLHPASPIQTRAIGEVIPPPPRTPRSTERTDADGRFSMAARGDIDHEKLRGGFDLFVMADGYVAAAVCALPNGNDVEVRLERGHRIQGTVRNVFNRPVKDVLIMAAPAEDTPKQLGHYAWTTTDEQGRYELTGLTAGAVYLTTRQERYMPKRVGPVDPKDGRPIDIELVSALLVTFQLETADGSAPSNPSLEWRTSGKPPHTGLGMLATPSTVDGTPILDKDGTYKTHPVAIPCDHREVTFTVKADGHEAWRSEPVLLPQEGGDLEVPVQLLADRSQGRVRITFETEGGESVAYTKLNAHARPIIRGTQTAEGGVVFQTGVDFRVTAIPPGPWSLVFHMPDYAPARVDFEVRAGEESAHTVTLRACARLRIRFVASEPMKVTFRITKDGRVAHTYLEDGQPATGGDDSKAKADEAPTVEASDEGVVFKGLGAGAHVIEVIDPNLRAERTRVTLVEGDETDIEIRVRRR